MRNMRYFKLFTILIVILTLFSQVKSQVLAAAGDTNLVSLALDGTTANSQATSASISADGRYIAFVSQASNLVSGDTNGLPDIFIRDTQTNTTVLASLASDGTQGNGSSFFPSISADGRYVAFVSVASNFISGDASNGNDIFVHDMQTGMTTCVSISLTGTLGNQYSDSPSISADGRYVAFQSRATNLVSNDLYGKMDIFIRDIQAQTTIRISQSSNGIQGDQDSSSPSISADGRYVAFTSLAGNLVSGDFNGMDDIFVMDMQKNSIIRVSEGLNGVQANSSSDDASVSADGRYIAFSSGASNLVSDDTNGMPDVFVYDLQMKSILLVSVSSHGTQANGISGNVSISADGGYVAFESYATNLVSGDVNALYDIFVYDIQENTTSLISIASDGTQANSTSLSPAISANGRYVAFDSQARNLIGAGTNGTRHVYVHDNNEKPPLLTISGNTGLPSVTLSYYDGTDKTTISNASGNYSFTLSPNWSGVVTPLKDNLVFTPENRTYTNVGVARIEQDYSSTRNTSLVSQSSDGTEGYNWESFSGSISADGRYIAFDSQAIGLVAGDTNSLPDVFLRDAQTNTTTLISAAPDGTFGNGSSSYPSISSTGRYIAFESSANNLISGDAGNSDIFVRDMQTGITTRISVASDGTPGNGPSEAPSISADGRYVAFRSYANNFVSGDANGKPDIFIHDLQANTTINISVDSNGTQGNNFSYYPSISADGRYVAFNSSASNLVNGDTNGDIDIFVHDIQTNSTIRVSQASDGTQANNNSYDVSVSGDGRYIAFDSDASNLVSDDTNGKADVFVYDTQANTTTRISLAPDGAQGDNNSIYPSISADGRYVAFSSSANNLASEDPDGDYDIFVRDLQTNTNAFVSATIHGIAGNNDSRYSTISASGRYVVFQSSASNLIDGGTNGLVQIFVRDNGAKYPLQTISGNVGLPGVTFNYYDGIKKTTIAGDSGNYSFTVSSNWYGTVTPSKPGYIFAPVNKTYSNVIEDQTMQDFTATNVSPITICQNVPTIANGQDIFGNLTTTTDIHPYQFDVLAPYTTIVATLVVPAGANFALNLYDSCQDGPISVSWGEIGKRYIHIGRRYIHIGPSGDESRTVEVRFNIGNQTGRYYLAVAVPTDGAYDPGQYKLHLDLEPANIGLINTTILYNPTRFQAEYGLDAASQMMDQLTQLAAHDKVKGVIIQLDQFPDLVAAYNNWDNMPVTSYADNVTKANLVADQINKSTQAFMQANHLLVTHYVVIIGDDHQIPFRRLSIGPDSRFPDSHWMLEKQYFLSLPSYIVKSSLDAALMANQTLSDDFYGKSIYLGPSVINLPSLAVGRLLDTPQRIQNTIGKFLAADGLVDMTMPGNSSAVAGYSFLTDSARQACAALQANATLNADCALINSSFSSGDLSQKFLAINRVITAYYGHTNHNQLVAADDSRLTAEQISATNLDSLAALWWMIGCQSGLVFPEGEGQPLSLAQALADHGVPLIGNTGWAWGTDGPAAYSELLYQLLTTELTKGGSIPVGRALLLAKQGYFFRTVSNLSAGGKGYLSSYYDSKVMAEATLYGLPMLEFRFPAYAAAAQTASKLYSTVAQADVSSQAVPASFSLQDVGLSELTYTSQQYKDGVVFIAPGDNQSQFYYSALQGKPMLPGYVVSDLSLPSLGAAKGVLFVSGDYKNQANNPLISSPAQLNATPATELDFNGTFPLFQAALSSQKELNGTYTNALAFKTGQIIGDQAHATLRLFTNIHLYVSRWRGDINDDTSPTLGSPLVSVNGNLFHVQMTANDTSGIYQVYLTHTIANNQSVTGSWKSIKKAGDCAISGPQTFGFDLPLPAAGELNYYIQVMDCAGNVSVKMNNNQYFKVISPVSLAAQDGWTLESSETSNVGGTLNAANITFNIGDDGSKRQYRGILSFNTGTLPDNAVITSVILKVKKQGIIGGNPFGIFWGLMADIKNGFFSAGAVLQANDFQAPASASYGPFAPTPVGDWYSINLTAGKSYINKLATNSGLTQIRLRFKLDDNNNAIANYLSLYSGNALAANRPQLVISYYVP